MSRNGDSGAWLAVVFVAIAVWFAVRESDWVAKAYAASHYDLPDTKIHVVGKRPHDCDFMTAPLGAKHCSYKREYLADWLTLSADRPPRPISFSTLQEEPPAVCSKAELDFAHQCNYTELNPGEQATPEWRARWVEIHWRKVEE